ncbi:uncharacterized protein LOC121005644 [Bufo bufo]|uniref:uncharacterized protein LOC121005644 n=1 Tax=Bufo bufo TaxID=8384 RepID=UPI001ABEDB07|nr:uncharacterized protein LOC121005644 [Bufo bufo]
MSAPVMTVEEMLERLRREAEVRGPGWLQEQVGACIVSPAPVATPNVRAARPRRSIPPARLSPEVTPRARRRVGSPPVVPQRRRAAAQPSASRSRRGRNPVTRLGPVRSGTPLPPLPAAVQLDSGPGTVDRPSPSFSGRSTRLFDEVRVPRTALGEDEYQRRSREDVSSVEEGPLAVAEAAASSRCPASVVQRVVQVVQEEQPSTSRSYDGAVSVRQESGSAAAGVTAPVVPGRMMAALVWILGHSYVFWGAIRADVRPSGRQLGVSPELATVRWLGVRGMLWGGVLREVHHFVRLDRPPDVLVLHVGGNDLGKRPFRELVRDVKFDLLRIWALFPGVIIVWSDIVPRKVWRGARSVESLNKARIKVNRAVGRFMARNGGVVVRHEVLEKGEGAFWRADGVHLNAVGTDLWALGLQSGVETALRMWRDAQG